MRGKIVIRSTPMASANRKQPETGTKTQTPVKKMRKSSSNVGEVAGGTAANCVVVSCCCPCVLLEVIMLAVYKVPVNLCRKIWRKKRQKMVSKKRKGKGVLEKVKEEEGYSVGEVYGKGNYVDEVSDVDWKEVEMIKVSIDGSAVELDRKMWDRFSNSGFWRSPSQRIDHDNHNNNDNNDDGIEIKE